MTDCQTTCCDCCEPPAAATPQDLRNRPGLTALAYRVGTFSSFRRAMLEAIAGEPALAGWTTRLSDDPGITLIELWAMVADVLSFYQERIANEAFLRTAMQRDSVQRLARLVDYELRPALAATTLLAFTVDAGKQVSVPVGLRVQSVPGQDEKPQKYETLEALQARSVWNRLAAGARPERAEPIRKGDRRLALPATQAAFEVGLGLRQGDPLAAWSATAFEMLTIAQLEPVGDQWVITWARAPQGDFQHLRKVGRTFNRYASPLLVDTQKKYLDA